MRAKDYGVLINGLAQKTDSVFRRLIVIGIGIAVPRRILHQDGDAPRYLPYAVSVRPKT